MIAACSTSPRPSLQRRGLKWVTASNNYPDRLTAPLALLQDSAMQETPLLFQDSEHNAVAAILTEPEGKQAEPPSSAMASSRIKTVAPISA